MKKNNLKVALVHDFLVDFGGAERVLEVLCEMFPEAPIYTLLYDKKKMRGRFAGKTIRTSFLQKFPAFLRRRKKWLLPLMPVAPEVFDLRDFDLVLSSSGAWSKGIVTRLNTIHISYIHSPMRFVWDANGEYLHQQGRGVAIRLCARWLMNYIRVWDKVAADRPDFLLANSKYTQRRIKKYYGRESTVIYPPVGGYLESQNDKVSNVKTDSGYFLVVSRLSPYKKVDAVVEAFNRLGLPLIVIGEGQQEGYLRSIAKENVKILGYRSDKETAGYYAGARAFVFAGVDDFGIAPVEAMACGVPVLAIRRGGIKEIVTEGKTGEFFDDAEPGLIMDGVRSLIENEKNYDKKAIVDRAKDFSKEIFMAKMEEYINKITNLQ
ncbi:MAG: glycosyltransferase [Candidatus Moranbacteria bacterium]|nr:glycosyltransferase [Candidatus Moranbacteria bacterium]